MYQIINALFVTECLSLRVHPYHLSAITRLVLDCAIVHSLDCAHALSRAAP